MTPRGAADNEKSWTTWFPPGNQSPEVQPAKAVVQDARQFFSNRVPKLGKNALSELITFLSHAKHPDDSQLRRPNVDILDRLNSVPLEQLSSYVKYEVAKMEGADARLAQKRSKGIHKAAAQAQDFTITFDQFLKAYSGIVDVLKQADSQYGNVASATLSLFYATVKIKADAEQSIHETMLEITDRLPEFEVYGRIYPDKAFGQMLAETYRDIILFARQVAIYFQDHGIVRYTSHFFRLGKFQSMNEDMLENSNRIKRKSEVLLAKKIDRLEKDNEEFRKREDVRLVNCLRNTLHLQKYRTGHVRDILKTYNITIKPQFQNDRRREKMDLQRFHRIPDAQVWEQKGSILLLLFGRNEMSRENTNHSWLSTVAVDIVEALLHSKDAIAFEECSHDSTLEEGMSRLIFQFLERDPHIVRQAEDFAEIESEIASTQDRSGDNRDERILTLRTALLRIINLHHGTVYIVLNRPERCTGDDESCGQYIETLVSLVQEATTELKILVVVKSELWDFERRRNEVNVRHAGDLFRAVRIDQGRC